MWDAKILGGSIQRGIVNPDLIKERQNCDFNQQELEDLILGPSVKKNKKMQELFQQHPEFLSDIFYHEMTRDEKMESWWKRHNLMMKVHPDFYIENSA